MEFTEKFLILSNGKYTEIYDVFNSTFFEKDIYASILLEDESTFALKTIESDGEMELVKERINELIS